MLCLGGVLAEGNLVGRRGQQCHVDSMSSFSPPCRCPMPLPQDPAQLLEVFSQLEASNMFLIAAAQEAEAALEAARAAHATTQVGALASPLGPRSKRYSQLCMVFAASQIRRLVQFCHESSSPCPPCHSHAWMARLGRCGGRWRS